MEREVAEDLDDLVRFQPGVSISTAARGGHEGFSIRGIGGNRVLTVLDGIRSNDIYHAGPSSYGRDNIDTDNIKTVELIRGPASALYGADAIGGAVILTSKDPRDYLEGDRAAFNFRASAADADAQYQAGDGHTRDHASGSRDRGREFAPVVTPPTPAETGSKPPCPGTPAACRAIRPRSRRCRGVR